MSASEAKFLISFTGYKADCFTVTKFSGEDEISRSYRFDIKFKLSEAIPSPWPSGGKPVLTAAALLGKPCHFKIMGSKNDLAAAYHGVIMAFDVEHGFDSKSNPAAPAYSLRLVPWIELLSLSTNNRVFQKLKAVDIIQKVIEEAVQEAAKDAELKEYCKFRLECGDKGKRKADIAYNEIDFCVQYQETDLNFISRLMEQNGIWYYFEERGKPDESGFREECMVITDSFDCFPPDAIKAPFVKDGTIQADSDKPKLLEVVKYMDSGSDNNENMDSVDSGSDNQENADAANADDEIDAENGENTENPPKQREYPCGIGESIHYLSSKSAIIPRSVHLRAYNYRTPEVFQDGKYTAAGVDCARGNVYEYGGAYKDTKEADRGATLYLQRLMVANMRTDGKSNCKAFRAGRLVAVTPKEIGTFLLVSVKHQGGGNDTHNYNNSFSCVNSAAKVYAPPLRAVQPRMGGLITARVDALGDEHPSIDETGRYKVKLPFDLSETEKYAATKYIRLSLPSGGKSGGETYGLHLPSKQGAEMVLAYVDGNPDKPVGLGFVPNGDTQSPVNCNVGKDLNVIRTWGGNELVMDDTPSMEKVILASSDTPAKKQGDAKDDAPPEAWKTRLDKRLESAKNFFNENADAMNSELVFDNAQKLAALRALKHKLVMACNNDNNFVIIATGNNHKIKIDDKTGIITVNTAKGCTLEMNDQKNTITLRDAGGVNSVAIDGEKKTVSLQSGGNIDINANGEITIKGKNVKIASGGAGGIPQQKPVEQANVAEPPTPTEPAKTEEQPKKPAEEPAKVEESPKQAEESVKAEEPPKPAVESAAEVATTPAKEAEPVAEEESETIADEKVYKRGDKGNVVLEINIRLAGFSGLVPDYEFTDRTEKGVIQFQEHYMKIEATGIVNYATLEKIDEFSKEYDISTTIWNAVKCSCSGKGTMLTAKCNKKKELNNCNGWGSGYGKGEYRGELKEAKHNYEYPGIHRSLLFALKALLFYLKDTKSEYSFAHITSGYRCHFRGYETTNHQGKAIDIQFNKGKWAIRGPEERNILPLKDIREKFFYKYLNAKTNWTPRNHFGLEPIDLKYIKDKNGNTIPDPNYSYSWIHLDVREFNQDYLRDDLFCKDSATLNGVPMTEIK